MQRPSTSSTCLCKRVWRNKNEAKGQPIILARTQILFLSFDVSAAASTSTTDFTSRRVDRNDIERVAFVVILRSVLSARRVYFVHISSHRPRCWFLRPGQCLSTFLCGKRPQHSSWQFYLGRGIMYGTDSRCSFYYLINRFYVFTSSSAMAEDRSSFRTE